MNEMAGNPGHFPDFPLNLSRKRDDCMRSEHELTQAMERYADMVKRICMMHLKNEPDTEDIFQTVFLKYMLYNGTFQSAEHEKAWFARITINACRDLLRSFFRRMTVPMEAAETFGTMAPDYSELRQIVLTLPEKYRDVIYLYYYENYSAVEIAEILHKSENTIYTWLARGRKLLKEKLGGDWYE